MCGGSEEDKPPQTPFSFLTRFDFISYVDVMGKKKGTDRKEWKLTGTSPWQGGSVATPNSNTSGAFLTGPHEGTIAFQKNPNAFHSVTQERANGSPFVNH